MTFMTNQMTRRVQGRLSKAGAASAGYFKVLLDLLSGRRNLFF